MHLSQITTGPFEKQFSPASVFMMETLPAYQLIKMSKGIYLSEEVGRKGGSLVTEPIAFKSSVNSHSWTVKERNRGATNFLPDCLTRPVSRDGGKLLFSLTSTCIWWSFWLYSGEFAAQAIRQYNKIFFTLRSEWHSFQQQVKLHASLAPYHRGYKMTTAARPIFLGRVRQARFIFAHVSVWTDTVHTDALKIWSI